MDLTARLVAMAGAAQASIVHASVAVPRIGGTAILSVVCSGGISAPPERWPRHRVTVMVWERTPDLIAPLRVAGWEDVEDAALDSAWRMGAWDVMRIVIPPLAPDQDWRDPKWGIIHAFGGRHYEDTGDLAPADACVSAARHGWVAYHWRPILAGAPRHGPQDKTLRPDGGRDGSPDVTLPPPAWHQAQEHVIRLGKANHPNRPKAPRVSPAKARLAAAIRAAGAGPLPAPEGLDAYIDANRHLLDRPRSRPPATRTRRTKSPPSAPPVPPATAPQAARPQPRPQVTTSPPPHPRPTEWTVIMQARHARVGDYVTADDPRIAHAPPNMSGGVIVRVGGARLCHSGRWRGHVVCDATVRER